MENLAGRADCNEVILRELAEANIPPMPVDNRRREVAAVVGGQLPGALFERAWYYWVAQIPSGLPLDCARKIHEAHGRYVRVGGDCTAPSPDEWVARGYNDIDIYHVDTMEGLKALAEAIRGAFAMTDGDDPCDVLLRVWPVVQWAAGRSVMALDDVQRIARSAPYACPVGTNRRA